jgi:phosphoacetylglucosamine mutase
MGDMLENSWEEYATQLANADGVEELKKVIHSIVAKQRVDLSQPANVIYGHDTRPSCQYLVRALAAGLSAAPYSAAGKPKSTNYGEVTTPILHYLTRCLNTNGTYGPATPQGYYDKLSNAFKKLVVSTSSIRIEQWPHFYLGDSL